MPELIANGPYIPANLTNEVEDGQAVFFCGAGISMGPESDLPGFSELVDSVYKSNRLEPDEVEKEALDHGEPVPYRRRPAFDKVLQLLERDDRLGSEKLRKTVRQILSAEASGPLKTHRALMDLSLSKEGVRLVTTNFDNRFVDAGLDDKLLDVAPKLPLPKSYSWSSVVHLHGHIARASDLVLTAADFGRAYLTERWAARFVTELFRQFTVVFVGYSLDDPVMGYLVDALAAERSKGAGFKAAYAFADYDGSATATRVQNVWRAKNVEPILYDRRGNHALLRQTLIEWARIRQNPLWERSQIALTGMSKLPTGPDDPIAQRVTWALQNTVSAENLAGSEPIRNEQDFPKLVQWLDIFDQADLLSCVPSSPESPTPLVDSGLHTQHPPTLDKRTWFLAKWIAQHLHVPQVLTWVLEKGGCMHPALRRTVRSELARPDVEMDQRLRHFWTILSFRDDLDYGQFLWLEGQLKNATSCVERCRLEEQVIRSIAPHLVVRAGASRYKQLAQAVDRAWDGNKDDEFPSMSAIDECAHLELCIGGDDHWHTIRSFRKDKDFLARHAEALTQHLEDALTLRGDIDNDFHDSTHYRPSIAQHEQNSGRYDDLGRLIDLVRDSYLTLSERNHARGKSLLERWTLSRFPLFKRLALHALTESTRSDLRIARRLLITARHPGLWELELRREVLRFLRLGGARLPPKLHPAIVRAIHAGPIPRPEQPPEHYDETIAREKGLRFRKLEIAGIALDGEAKTLADRSGGGKPR